MYKSKIDLKAAREARNKSQEELADECGVTRQAISNIELGLTKPKVETAKKIAEVLGLDWPDFFTPESNL